jgi:hypothetical protein
MNGDEVGKLLGLMALADNRKPPQDEEGQAAMIAFWLSMVGDLAYADAAQAVGDHYRETREWIMPSDIRRRVREMQFERLRVTPLPDPPDGLGDDPAAYVEWLAAERKKIINAPLAGPRALEGP